MGISEFEQAIRLMHEKKYDESEAYLKDALKILKSAQLEKSLGYIYLLKRLGYVAYLNRKYSESEKYFKVVNDMTPIVTKNPLNIFSSQKNLLILYTLTDLEKATQLAE